MHYEDIGAAILQDVSRLFTLEMPVERREVGAQLARSKHHLHKRGLIVHHDGNGVALVDAGRCEGAGSFGRAGAHLRG